MTIPNIITVFRIFLVPLFWLILKSSAEFRWNYFIILLSVSALTDIFDGLIARRFNMKSKLGALLDPVADKLVQLTVFLCLASENIIPFFLFLIIIIKDFISLIAALYLLKSRTVISANYSGKTATVIFYVSSFILIMFRPSGIINLLIVSVIIISALYSLINYSIIFLKTIINKGK